MIPPRGWKMSGENWLADLSKLDHSDMYRKILEFPSMIKRAIELSAEMKVPNVKGLEDVVFCGMGGSGMGPELVRSWLMDEATVPIDVIRDYRLPGYVSPNTLVCVISYSGDTEESVSCLKEAISRGAKLVSISSDGEMEHLSSESGVPHLKVPAGFTPRSALPYLFVPLVKLLQANGIVSPERMIELQKSVASVEAALESVKVEVPTDKNESKSLAAKLFGKFPLVYGHGILSGVALRFRQQLNENAKMMASTNAFPEFDHNELEAKRFIAEGKSVAVLLRSRFESDVLRSKIDASRQILESNGQAVLELRVAAQTAIAEALSFIAKLDMTSLYLALLNGVDPSSTPRINALKEMLGARY